MAEKEKKFFWLKLKEDFFTSEIAIKKLRKIAGGDTYTIIYLKILLRSLRDSGKIFFEGVDDSFHEELALILDEEPDNVLFTLTFLEKCGLLVKTSDYEYELTAIPNMTGSESESAPRVRRFREKQKMLQCNADVTECNEDVQKCNTEIEIETEKKIEKSKEKKTVKQYSDDPELNETILSFIKFRKDIKKPMNDHTIDLLIKKLEKMDPSIKNQIEILNQSMVNGWQGIFPLKESEIGRDAERNSKSVGKTKDDPNSIVSMLKGANIEFTGF